MAKAVNGQKSNKPSFAAKVLQNMTLGSDLSINRPAIQTGFFRHWWQTFRANYGSLVLQNIMCLLLAAPFIAFVFFIMPQLEQRWILQSGFNFVGDLGFGFTGGTNDTTLAIRGIYLFRLMFYSLIIPCFSLMGVGMAGLFYSSRNVAWGAKVKFRHFFRGIKKYWWQYLLAFTVIGVAAYGVLASIFGYLYMNIAGMTTWYMWFVMIFACLIAILVVYFMLMYLPMVTMYDFSNKVKIKNSILLAIALILPATMLSILWIGLPIAFIWSSITKILLLATFALFGFAAYATSIQCFGVYAADNYTEVLYQNMLYLQEKEKRKQTKMANKNAGKQSKINNKKSGKSNKYNRKAGNYDRNEK